MNNPGLITHAQGPSATFSLATKLSVDPVHQTIIAFVMQQLEQGMCKSQMSTSTNWPSCEKSFNNIKVRLRLSREFCMQLRPDCYSL
jgi:hypothetical protein